MFAKLLSTAGRQSLASPAGGGVTAWAVTERAWYAPHRLPCTKGAGSPPGETEGSSTPRPFRGTSPYTGGGCEGAIHSPRRLATAGVFREFSLCEYVQRVHLSYTPGGSLSSGAGLTAPSPAVCSLSRLVHSTAFKKRRTPFTERRYRKNLTRQIPLALHRLEACFPSVQEEDLTAKILLACLPQGPRRLP